MTFLDLLGGVIDAGVALAAAGLLAVGGTLALRNRRPGPVRLLGGVVRHSRLVATWMLLTGGWALLVAAKRAGLPVSGLLLIVLMAACLAVLAVLLVRVESDRPPWGRLLLAVAARWSAAVRERGKELLARSGSKSTS